MKKYKLTENYKIINIGGEFYGKSYQIQALRDFNSDEPRKDETHCHLSWIDI